MKRVLCFIENLGSGGAERQLSGLSVMLRQQNYEVEVAYYVKKEFYLPFLKENGIECRFLNEANRPHTRIIAIRRYIKQWKPDIVITYSESPGVIACLFKILGFSFRLIVSERNTTQQLNRREKIKFFFYRWADVIVPNSESQANFITKNFPELTKKVTVITNYVDTDKFSPSQEPITKHDVLKMVCVGRLMPQKNLPRFIEAIAKVLRDGYRIHVDWYGQDLEDDYSKEVHNEIVKSGIGESFIFHSPSDRIQEKYRDADVFCLPSLYEGFPNTLCEAMSCGKPVLCSHVCDNPNIVAEGVNGLMFDPLNINDIAETIKKYINMPDEMKCNMGKMSRKIAVKKFSQESFIQKYINILGE